VGRSCCAAVCSRRENTSRIKFKLAASMNAVPESWRRCLIETAKLDSERDRGGELSSQARGVPVLPGFDELSVFKTHHGSAGDA